jgi:hypothetical protein
VASPVNRKPSAKGRLVALILILVALVVLGASACWSGIDGYLAGEILVRPKSHPAYMAYRDGMHAAQFVTLVCLSVVGGALFLSIGLFGLGVLVFGSPEQRAKMLALSTAVRRRRQATGIAWWIPIVILVVVFFVLLIYLRTSA